MSFRFSTKKLLPIRNFKEGVYFNKSRFNLLSSVREYINTRYLRLFTFDVKKLFLKHKNLKLLK